MLSPKQMECFWQDRKKAKANREDIPAAKKRCGQPPPPKQAKHLESAVATQKRQISSLTAQNKKMIVALTASGIDIPVSDPSLEEDEGKDRKMTSNRKNSNLTKTNKSRKWRAGQPQGNNRSKTVKSTCSQSNHIIISVELDSYADTCLVSSNVLVIHDHKCFVDVYGFDQETQHSNASTVDVAIHTNTPSCFNSDPYDQLGYQDW